MYAVIVCLCVCVSLCASMIYLQYCICMCNALFVRVLYVDVYVYMCVFGHVCMYGCTVSIARKSHMVHVCMVRMVPYLWRMVRAAHYMIQILSMDTYGRKGTHVWNILYIYIILLYIVICIDLIILYDYNWLYILLPMYSYLYFEFVCVRYVVQSALAYCNLP